jgi:hypothetical protein
MFDRSSRHPNRPLRTLVAPLVALLTLILCVVCSAQSVANSAIVVGVGSAPADSTWPVAMAVYRASSLRPVLTDSEARTLAGEAPAASASSALLELAELRSKSSDDATGRAMLAEVAKRTHAKTLVVVFTFDPPRAAEVRLFDAATSVFGNTRYQAENGTWNPLVSALVTMNAPPTPSSSASADLTKKGDLPFYKSPWFWGSVGVAAAVSVIVYLAFAHSSTSTSAAQLKW